MRPVRVYPNKLHLYNKMLTRKIKMWCGTEITALHLLKETQHFFTSISAWTFCVSTFKKLKYNTELKVEFPILKDETVKTFLNYHAWHDWVDKQTKTAKKESDMLETLEFLNRLFPDKKKVFFYELKHLIGAYCHGSFISYDDDGNIKTPHKYDIDQRIYYTKRYNGEITGNDVTLPDEITNAITEWVNCKDDEKKRDELLTKYHDLERNYLYKNHDLTKVFKTIGENIVVCPYIYKSRCVEGSSYENAGDIYFIVTDDTIYFETERHF